MQRKGNIVLDTDKLDKYPEIVESITKGLDISYLLNPQNYLSFKFIEDSKFFWKTNNTEFTRTIEYCKMAVHGYL